MFGTVAVIAAILVGFLALLYIVERPPRRRRKFDRIVASGNVEQVKQFIARHPRVLTWESSRFDPPLHAAAFTRNVEAARVLLAAGMDPNVLDRVGATPLVSAVRESLEPHPFTATCAMVDFLLAAGAQVNPTHGRFTPLHCARYLDTVKLLLERGASPNARDWNGGTPLHNAVAHWENDAVRLLITSGADLNAQDNYGERPIDSVIKDYLLFGGGVEKEVRELIALGASVEHLDDATIERLNEYPRSKKIENSADVETLRRIVKEAKARRSNP